MKILLVALNASYMHTNIAIRSLTYYGRSFIEQNNIQNVQINFCEFTINQPCAEILRGLAESEADVVLFSTYIWNTLILQQIIPDVKKVLPDSLVGAGGPEFGYGAKKYLTQLPTLDFIIHGEGEETFTELINFFTMNQGDRPLTNSPDFASKAWQSIKGLYLRQEDKIVYTGDRPLLQTLDSLPFNYPELLTNSFEPDNKIYYYESSRGCPYSCSYCLSSVDKRVRFKSLEQTCKELQIFLDANVKLVKFVDRTYNLKPERYIKIWEYILSHHNNKTMFHFEIEAEYLTKEALDFLQKVPEGVMQFEMGVQTANKQTLESVNRSPNTEILAQNIRQIPRTIHQHLDLIAGLPYEDLESFGKSYDFVMSLKPDALQLGFLKVLPGTQMEEFAATNGWKWQESAVYETFSTPYMPYKDINFLKDIEHLTDAYWNKGSFSYTMNYVFRKVSPWAFLSKLAEYGRQNNTFDQARRETYWFELLFTFFESACKTWTDLDYNLCIDLLRYDFVRSGKKGNFPTWYKHRYQKEKHQSALEKEGLLHNCRVAFSYTEYEEFDYDVRSDFPENYKTHTEILIKYK